MLSGITYRTGRAPNGWMTADLARQLSHRLAPLLVTDQLESVYRELEMPLIPVLADMERRHEAGFFVARFASRTRPSYRLRIENAGEEVSRNFYWLPPKPDVLDWANSKWFYTPTSEYADLTAVMRAVEELGLADWLDGLPQLPEPLMGPEGRAPRSAPPPSPGGRFFRGRPSRPCRRGRASPGRRRGRRRSCCARTPQPVRALRFRPAGERVAVGGGRNRR